MIDKPDLATLRDGLCLCQGGTGQDPIASDFDDTLVAPRAEPDIIVLQNGIDLHPARLAEPGTGRWRSDKS
jgi:hypothetical protein